jgi:tRNA(adenine34) deaminase
LVKRIEVHRRATVSSCVVTLQRAVAGTGASRLDGAVLYTTLEPCVMCLGACLLHHISHIVFAAASPKFGACGSAVDVLAAAQGVLNHKPMVTSGILADESTALLKAFFHSRRSEGA